MKVQSFQSKQDDIGMENKIVLFASIKENIF